MLDKLPNVNYGFKFAGLMFFYFAASSLLQLWVPNSIAQALALLIASISAYPLMAKPPNNFLKHAIYSVALSVVVFVLLEVMS